jgi:hypothetical protein
MQLVDAGILEAAVGLSVPLCAGGLLIGVLLWIAGGLMHRFWVVVGATVLAGVAGMYWGKQYDMQPLVAGLLVAVSVGSLALALFRIALFLVSGLTVAWVASVLAPSWNESIACFFAGGLLGIALYRLCVIVLASFAGTLLIGYSGLVLASTFGNVDVVALADKQAPLMNWAVGAVTVLGVLVQIILHRRRKAALYARAEEDEWLEERRERRERRLQRKASWWNKVAGSERKAG